MCAVWKAIQPKLEELIKQNQQQEQQQELNSRRRSRFDEFRPIWTDLLDTTQDPLERSLMPHVDDACELPHIADMIYEDEARIPVTEERWLAIVDSIPEALAHYQKKLKRRVVERLKIPPFYELGYSSYGYLKDETPDDATYFADDFHRLDQAKSVLVCTHLYDCHAVLSYPDMFLHKHVAGLPLTSATRMLMRNTAVEAAAQVLLKTLGLPEDAPRKTLDEMNGRLQCLCGHPKFRKPTSANELASTVCSAIKILSQTAVTD